MYLPLFDIVVEHQFFLNGMRRTLVVAPTVRTEALTANLGLLSRQTPNGIRLLYEVQRLQALQQDVRSAQSALQLGFKLTTSDHLFASYTEPICPGDSLFFFDQSCAQAEIPKSYRLHCDAQVSAHEVEPLVSLRLDELLDDADRVGPLIGVIEISLSPSTEGLFDAQLNVTSRTYEIRFAARKTYWTYYLLGNLARDGLYMEDADGEVEFKSLGKISLPGNQVAQAFRSTSMLPFRDRYHNRFQIVDPAADGDRILMARMPGADVRQARSERLNGTDLTVSEIFIKGF